MKPIDGLVFSAPKKGFTLLELSIVLVIIGLLIGGIFVGQSLIHTAQLNAVVSEFNRYQTATQNFQQQYQGLPGDLKNATSFWGSLGGTGSDATCQVISSTTAATCNGNGDGQISWNVSPWDENMRYWQHLSNAKMIEGSYIGSAYLSGTQFYGGIPGSNVPASKIGNNNGWFEFVGSGFTPSGYVMAADYGTGHILIINGLTTSTGSLSPKDAWFLDKKFDDGKPGLGNIIVYYWGACTNAANNADLAATYKLNVTTPLCSLIFIASF